MEKELQPKIERRETEPSEMHDIYMFPVQEIYSLTTELGLLKLELQRLNKHITAMVIVKDQLVVNVEKNN